MDTLDLEDYFPPASDPASPLDFKIDFERPQQQVDGTIKLRVLEFLSAQATFSLSRTRVGVDTNLDGAIGDSDLKDASLVTITLRDTSLFVGANASLEQFGQAADNGIGFQVTGADLVIATVRSSQTGDQRAYTAIKASLDTASLEGFEPDLVADASSVLVEVNQATNEEGNKDNGLDWTRALDLDGDGVPGAAADRLDVGQTAVPPVHAGPSDWENGSGYRLLRNAA